MGEERGLRKGAIVSSSPQGSGYDKLELKHQNMFFFKLIECIINKKICHGVKQYAKVCAIGEQNVIN